jgi:polyketide biosynthesis 3-hydroxy-3-methylglutaryl-CoA synthase-like enzyme PksG
MGGTIMLSLASTVDHGQFDTPRRVGCFSYGSGCCAEFYSGVVTRAGQESQRRFEIGRQLDERYRLNMDEYHTILQAGGLVKFGTRNMKVDAGLVPGAVKGSGRPRLMLTEIHEFHRRYEWCQ